MNKSNKILLGILSFIVVCVMGYALFSENITVTGTATAKGSFDVSVSCTKGFVSELKTAAENDGWGFDAEGGYKNDTCAVNGNKVDFNVDLEYPGADRYFTITVTNTGTIDAIADIEIFRNLFKNQQIKVYNKSNDSLYKTYTYDNYEEWVEGAKEYAHFTDDRWYDDGGLFFGKNKSGNIFVSSNLNDFIINGMYVADIDAQKGYLRIKTGESVSFIVNARWDEDATDNARYSVVTASAELPFQQITSNMVEYPGE